MEFLIKTKIFLRLMASINLNLKLKKWRALSSSKKTQTSTSCLILKSTLSCLARIPITRLKHQNSWWTTSSLKNKGNFEESWWNNESGNIKSNWSKSRSKNWAKPKKAWNWPRKTRKKLKVNWDCPVRELRNKIL